MTNASTAAAADPRRGTPERLAELRSERERLRPLLLGDWQAYDAHRRGDMGCREIDFAPPHAAIRVCLMKVMTQCLATLGRRDFTPADFCLVLRAEGVVGTEGVYTHRYGGRPGEAFTFARLPLSYVVGIATRDDVPGEQGEGGDR